MNQTIAVTHTPGPRRSQRAYATNGAVTPAKTSTSAGKSHAAASRPAKGVLRRSDRAHADDLRQRQQRDEPPRPRLGEIASFMVGVTSHLGLGGRCLIFQP